MRNITIHIHSSSLKEVSTFTFRMNNLKKAKKQFNLRFSVLKETQILKKEK